MGWDKLPVLPTFERARRREIYKKLAAAVKGEDEAEELPSLAEVRKRLRLFDQRYVGIEPIPVANIVGTVDRRPEFSREFLPKEFETRERWRAVEQAFPLSDFPPIVVYRVDEAYFVVDGHHRVGVAKMRGIEFIDAEITELDSRGPLGPDVDIAEVIHREQQQTFMEESGLDRARPEVTIEFTRPLGYVELLDLVKVYGYHLMLDRSEVRPREEIAARWYDEVYAPAVQTLRDQGLMESFPDRTEGDLFLWVYQRRQAFFPEHGGMTFEEVARRVREE
jgi:hypothetical protein